MLADLGKQALFLFRATVPDRGVVRGCPGRRTAHDAHAKVVHHDTPPRQLGFRRWRARSTGAAGGQVFYAIDGRNNDHRSVFIEQGAFQHVQTGAACLFIAEARFEMVEEQTVPIRLWRQFVTGKINALHPNFFRNTDYTAATRRGR